MFCCQLLDKEKRVRIEDFTERGEREKTEKFVWVGDKDDKCDFAWVVVTVTAG